MPTASKAKTEWALKALVILAAFLGGLYLFLNSRNGDTPYITLASQQIQVDLANTPELRRQGLSGRTSLNDNQAMLFVFDQPAEHAFWMKDMLIDIDIIWIDADKRVVHIEKNLKPDSYPTAYQPNTPALYVLETAAGWSDRYDLQLGDQAEFNL